MSSEWLGRVAAVTGAASGIGRALSQVLAQRGCHLALADVDAEGLEVTVRAARAHGVRLDARHVDVADRKAVHDWADAVAKLEGGLRGVFNNAGVALGASVRRMTLDELEWLMGVNFWGVAYGTKAFLPHLEAAGGGHVVNISSVFGLVGFPGNGAYNAAKFAVRGLSEALAVELLAERSPVQVHCVHPGGVRTRIARNARIGAQEDTLAMSDDERHAAFTRVARLSPERAAEIILDGVRRGRRRIVVGTDARLISAIQRLFPAAYQRLFAIAARRRLPGQI